MTMRTMSDWAVVLTICIGVPKSFTSSRRRNTSGKLVFMKSITTVWPCLRTSTADWALARSMITRPVSPAPRRKSISSIVFFSLARLLDASVIDFANEAPSGSDKVTTNSWFWERVEKISGRFNASTSRVRPATWIISTCRKSPLSKTRRSWPVAFAVSAKSNTTRGGFCVVKLRGVIVGNCLKLICSCCCVPLRATSIEVIAFRFWLASSSGSLSAEWTRPAITSMKTNSTYFKLTDKFTIFI